MKGNIRLDMSSPNVVVSISLIISSCFSDFALASFAISFACLAICSASVAAARTYI
jgi:hypothetical protein